MTSQDDPWGLARFVAAQRDIFDVALVEVASGRKRSHWMWYVFPQLAGLGRSAMAQEYALGGREEFVSATERHRSILRCRGTFARVPDRGQP